MSHCISGLPHDISSACGIASQQCYVLCQQPSPARQPGHLVLLATQDVSCHSCSLTTAWLDPLGFTLLTSRRLSSHSPASARQRLASRDLQFADAKVHCSVARHCWTSTKYTHCDAASSRSFSLHMFCHFAFVRTKLHSDLMTILAPAPQPPAPSPQPPAPTGHASVRSYEYAFPST